jgi:hypothetical protein
LTLYEKRGRRYFPVRDDRAYEGLANGSWLVLVEGGRRTTVKVVDPEPTLEQLAATEHLAEMLTEELRKSSAYEFTSGGTGRPLSAKERRAVAAYREVMGREASIWMRKPAAWDAALGAVRRLIERVKPKGTKHATAARKAA